MPRKSRKLNPLLLLSPKELIAHLRRHHQVLQVEWQTRLTIYPDWNYLEELHHSIMELERVFPWLKQEEENNL